MPSDHLLLYSRKSLLSHRKSVMHENPLNDMPVLIGRVPEKTVFEDSAHDWKATDPDDLWDDPSTAKPWAPTDKTPGKKQAIPNILDATVLEKMLQQRPSPTEQVKQVDQPTPLKGDRQQGMAILNLLQGNGEKQHLTQADIALNASHTERLKQMVLKGNQTVQPPGNSITMNEFLEKKRSLVGNEWVAPAEAQGATNTAGNPANASVHPSRRQRMAREFLPPADYGGAARNLQMAAGHQDNVRQQQRLQSSAKQFFPSLQGVDPERALHMLRTNPRLAQHSLDLQHLQMEQNIQLQLAQIQQQRARQTSMQQLLHLQGFEPQRAHIAEVDADAYAWARREQLRREGQEPKNL
ncbi:MAG: uncharacterized protein KVP18_004842 [Porospora cf. gigantea A]|uniref:uncharacterized protein n=1 Tax=Porospora cf. gigantea A TaxID=2853593 RepID=UPI00355A3A61|nr:MAG: hypothetical protein KVP18_004842 [Porospora cf. gigantea A]